MASDLLKPAADQTLETEVWLAGKPLFVDLNAVWCEVFPNMWKLSTEIPGNDPRIEYRSGEADAKTRASTRSGERTQSPLALFRWAAIPGCHKGSAPKPAFITWFNSKNEAHARG